MTYREFLVLRSAELPKGGTAFLDASILLAHCLDISRETLLTRFPERIDEASVEAFSDLWKRRLSGESVAYILGRKEFYGRNFIVDGRVLVPRPDTETLVEAALEIGDDIFARIFGESPSRSFRLHDVCTGSGAVAVSIAAERPGWLVSASDLSTEALDVAEINASLLLGRRMPLAVADLLGGVEGPFDVITANPPYVPSLETERLLALGWGEPRLALDGGRDGLDLVRRLAGEAFSRLFPGGFLLIETDDLQSEATRDILIRAGFGETRVWKDLAGLERVTGAQRP